MSVHTAFSDERPTYRAVVLIRAKRSHPWRLLTYHATLDEARAAADRIIAGGRASAAALHMHTFVEALDAQGTTLRDLPIED